MSVNVTVLISVPKSLLLSLILTLQPLISCNLYFFSLSKRPWIFRKPKRGLAQLLPFFLCSLLPNITILCITGRHKKKRTKGVLSKCCDLNFRSPLINGMWQWGASATKGTSPFCTAIIFFPGPFPVVHWDPWENQWPEHAWTKVHEQSMPLLTAEGSCWAASMDSGDTCPPLTP